MSFPPRNQFNSRLSMRYWDIPIDVPQAVQLNTPIGTRPCDTLGFICHPQKYVNYHDGKNYRNIDVESDITYNLFYYNPFDCTRVQHPCMNKALVDYHFSGISTNELLKKQSCPYNTRVWNYSSKLDKFGTHN